MVENTRSEDTLVFNALSPDVSNMTKVYNALENLFNVKKADDPSDRFNIILFQEDGPNYLQNFTLYPENVLIAMKSLEPVLVRANVAGGIFVAITFIIDVYKKISEKCFRLIILTDSGSLKIPDQYVPVLENLIDKVKDMPFYIDVVRLDIDDPREDLKLMKLARRCNGDIHEINDIRALESILEVLAIKREITGGSYLDEGDIEIPEESQPFYENLADDPINVEGEHTCSVCFQKGDKGMVKCPSCETITHKACWSMWAKNSHIGLPHVFRCHSCYNLVKLDENFLLNIQLGKTPEEIEKEIKVESINVQKWLESLEEDFDEGPNIIQVMDSLPVSAEESDDMLIQWDDEEEFKEVYDTVMDDDDFKTVDDDGFKTVADDDLRIIWCPNCSKITTNEYSKCPHCDEDISGL